MATVPRLAAAQTIPVARDVDANVKQHLALARRAAEEGVKLLVFPELSLTGYELEAGPELAFDTDDARLQPLRDAARAFGMTLVVGAPLRAASGLHIAALALDPTSAVHAYAKQHLGAFRAEDGANVPPPEATYFQPGKLDPMLAWHGHSVALSVCADSAYPTHTEAAAKRGATIYLSCQFAIEAHMGFKLSRLKDAAKRHDMVIVFANYGGPTGGLPSAGASSVRSPQGETIARLPAEGLGLAIAWRNGDTWFGASTLCVT